jgi:23S rRNA (cytidine1920-2'-O)/16S rRNA (cytidine1409-2'-O)-methyltransferase
MRRARLDAELVRRGLARSRDQAADLIAGGQVLVSGQAAAKAATLVAYDAAITVQRENARWRARGVHRPGGRGA